MADTTSMSTTTDHMMGRRWAVQNSFAQRAKCLLVSPLVYGIEGRSRECVTPPSTTIKKYRDLH